MRETGDIDASREPFSQTFQNENRETVTIGGLGVGPEFDAGAVIATTEATASVGTLGGYNAAVGSYALMEGDYDRAQDQYATSLMIAAGAVRSTEIGRTSSAAAADDAMIRSLSEQRAATGKTDVGNATYGAGRNANGTTSVKESIPGGAHAEIQVLNDLKGGSQRTVAVDQYPCSGCQEALPNGTRVVVPKNPSPSGTQNPKTISQKAAAGKLTPESKVYLEMLEDMPSILLENISSHEKQRERIRHLGQTSL
ncbi:hypothetical protein [Cerasicoccus maritimus]|uniref:hypothetical protein n=1 Tax=Cerasicoccus maritimus TaxID=490089 RepID=UPI0028528A90|nr:hypothetical protein [Cerasicoccus maritimus]